MNWLLRLLGFKEKPLPALTQKALLPVHSSSLEDIFLEAIQESHEEVYELERELLNDDKLKSYIKAAVKEMNTRVNKDSYDFILIHPHDCGVNTKIWFPFAQIMIALCKSIDLPATDEGSYLKVMKKDVRRAFGALKKQIIDIDERTRSMLSQGIYR